MEENQLTLSEILNLATKANEDKDFKKAASLIKQAESLSTQSKKDKEQADTAKKDEEDDAETDIDTKTTSPAKNDKKDETIGDDEETDEQVDDKKKKQPTQTQDKKHNVKRESTDLQQDILAEQAQKPQIKRGETKMDKNKKEWDGLRNYLKSNGMQRDGITSADNEVVIPVDNVYSPDKQPQYIDNLASFSTISSVSTPSGTKPIRQRNLFGLATKAELAKTPAAKKLSYKDVDYKVQTYAGGYEISQEDLDDAGYDLEADLVSVLNDAQTTTDNRNIATKLMTFDTKKITGSGVAIIDQIKHVKNVDLNRAYANKQIVLTQSAYNLLDTLKDANGRYYLQNDATSATGFKFLSMDLLVIDDDLFNPAFDGTSATHKEILGAFIGDVASAVGVFRRKTVNGKFIDDVDDYSTKLALYYRADYEVLDNEAGFYLDLSAATAEPANSASSAASTK